MTALIGPRDAPDVHVMTFNIRRRMQHTRRSSPDLWAKRAPALRELLRVEQPALVGIQEALPDQGRFVRKSLGEHYRRLGHGRNADGSGEGCPIYFDTRRFELLQWGQLALSDTPHEPGSKTWGNMIPRVLVMARLGDRATGSELVFINTHFDHRSRRSRVKAATLVSSLSGNATIITGDFNTAVDTSPFAEFARDGFHDTWDSAPRRLTAEWGTYPNYRAPKLDRKRIDWILAGRRIEASEVGINVARYGGIAPSDHLPVQAVVRVV